MKNQIIRIGDRVHPVYGKGIKGLVVGTKFNFGVRIYTVKIGKDMYDYNDDEIKKI